MLGCAADRLVLLSPQHLVRHTSIPSLLTLDKKHLQIPREQAWKHLEKGNRLLVCDRGGLKVCDGVEINVFRKTSLQSINMSYKSTFFLGKPKQQQKDAQYLFYKFARNLQEQIPQARNALSKVRQHALGAKTKGKL